jgi:hypothetical protein
MRVLSTTRTMRSFLNRVDMRSLNTASCRGIGQQRLIGPTWWQALDASALSSARPGEPLTPPARSRET